ncbi:MAG: NADH-quinone oxidoreductase subunit NuoE [Alphaproteobacteria bacterium]|nr:NADH-quinone oxidoreductase subunit NuoE [Alphaproteobacteria bacterium]
MTSEHTFTFNEQKLKKAHSHVAKYPNGRERSAIKALLDLAQRQADDHGVIGSLTKEKIEYVANFLNMPVVMVYEVASFYTMFNLKPVGKYHIKVCGTVPCCLVGSDDLTKTCTDKLNMKMGETTPDQVFTLTEVECLGACVNAPVVQINDDYYEDLTPADMAQILEDLKENRPIQTGSYKKKGGEIC